MVDKRQSRKDNQESFAAVINQFRQRVAEHGRVPAKLHCEGQTVANVDTGIDVFVRKRPQFKHEVQRGEYDIVTVPFENQARAYALSAPIAVQMGSMVIEPRDSPNGPHASPSDGFPISIQ